MFTFFHLPIVAGTVLFAVGVEGAVAEPQQAFEPFRRWAIGGGIVLYLSGFVLSHARSGHGLLVERAVGALVVAVVVATLGSRVHAVWLLVILAVINVAMTASEAVRWQRTGARGS